MNATINNMTFHDKELESYYSNGYRGLRNLNNGKEILPYLSHIIITDTLVFIEVDGKWGVIDRELRLILPPVYDELYTVNKIDRENFLSRTVGNSSITIPNVDLRKYSYIILQPKHIIYTRSHYGLDRSLYDINKDDIYERSKAAIFELRNDYGDSEYLIGRNEKSTQVIHRNGDKLELERNFESNEFYLAWHYKADLFIVEQDGFYSFSRYKNDILTGKDCFIMFNMGDNSVCQIDRSPSLVFHRNEFLSVCLPVIHDEKGKELNLSRKWALYKFSFEETFFENVQACFKQLTPFALEVAPRQMKDNSVFICRADGRDFLVKCNNEKVASHPRIPDECSVDACNLFGKSKSPSFTIDEFLKICFQGCLEVISPTFDNVSLRDDGMYNVYTKDGIGVYDEEMHEIIPAKYDRRIEEILPLIIVSRNDKCGVVNNKGEQIVPCIYDYLKIGKDLIDLGKLNSCYNSPLSNSELAEDDCFIVCIKGESKSLFSSFNVLLQKNIPVEHLQSFCNSHCDVYSSHGDLLACYQKVPQGGISYLKEFDVLVSYYNKLYSVEYGEFLQDVQLFFIGENKFSPVYSQVLMLNKKYFLAMSYNSQIGVVANNAEGDECCQWVSPCMYYKISCPINDMIYAYKRNGDSNIIDIYDFKDEIKLLLSTEVNSEKPQLLEDIDLSDFTEDQINRFIKKEDVEKMIFFPFDNWRGEEGSYDNQNYGYDDSLRDAFEDDSDSMWGRLD